MEHLRQRAQIGHVMFLSKLPSFEHPKAGAAGGRQLVAGSASAISSTSIFFSYLLRTGLSVLVSHNWSFTGVILSLGGTSDERCLCSNVVLLTGHFSTQIELLHIR